MTVSRVQRSSRSQSSSSALTARLLASSPGATSYVMTREASLRVEMARSNAAWSEGRKRRPTLVSVTTAYVDDGRLERTVSTMCASR